MNIVNYKKMRNQWDRLNELDHFFNDDFFNFPVFSNLQSQKKDWSPSVDVIENENNFLFQVDLPDIKKEEVKIEVKDRVLTITGERKTEKENKKYHRIERFYGQFSRSFWLPDNVDEEKIKAEYKNGVLEVQVEKKPNSKPKSIDIQVS